MKRFVVIVSIVVVLALVVLYLVQYRHFYLNIFPERPVEVIFSADETQLYEGSGATAKEVALRGVMIEGVIPGHYNTDYAATEVDYPRWFQQIAEMGANTVSVRGIMDPEFYTALAEHNTAAISPLYLLQGVSITSYDGNNAEDYYGVYEELSEDMYSTVDVIHGARPFSIGRTEGSGSYTADVSPWTIGYVIGQEYIPATVAYTDHNSERPTQFVGEYFSSAEGAGRTEVFLATMMDAMMSYESNRYQTQRLMTFGSSYLTDPLQYTTTVQLQLGKYVQLDIQNIVPSDKVQSGLFAGYAMRAGMEDFVTCLSDEDLREHIEIVAGLDRAGIYGGYVEFLNAYHEMPVVITSYGHSSARVGGVIEDGEFVDRLTEEAQGEQLVSNYHSFVEDGSAGVVIASWQDDWSGSTWNTRFAVELQREIYWHDAQTKDAANGLLSFDASGLNEVCTVDGDGSEWAEEDVLIEGDSYALSLRYDEAYLYLKVEGEDIMATPLAIPLDITPKTGSRSMEEPHLRFTEAADFVLLLDGRRNTRLLVQERYDAARANFEEEISDVNAYVYPPSSTSDNFVPIRVVGARALQPGLDIEGLDTDDSFKRLPTTESGKLVHGNANPTAKNYHSLADFCFGENVVEIRLPWQMLNFSDPSEMMVHDDYYPNYGVSELGISGISLGVSRMDSQRRILMNFAPLTGWGETIDYTERLKQSYEIVQAAWLGGID